MIEPMTPDRFRELADAYGGVVARWPADRRDAAMRIAAEPKSIAILAQASALDEMLDGWAMPAPATGLADRMAESAPTAKRSHAARARLWWSGIGVAAALAGAVSGTAAVALFSPTDSSLESGTSFGAVDPQDG